MQKIFEMIKNFIILILVFISLRLNAQNTVYVNSQTELINAIQLSSTQPINTIYCLNDFAIDSIINLPGLFKSKTKTIEITKGSFTCNNCFVRKPTDQAEAETWMQTNIRFTDCAFYGKGTGIALDLGAMFGGGATNCFFYNYDIAIVARFQLNGNYTQNRFSNCAESIRATIPDWPGGNTTKSCNGLLRLQNRAYNRDSGRVAFSNYYGSVSYDIMNISEGGSTVYDYYYKGGNTAKNYTNIGSYIEHTVTGANFKLDIAAGSANIIDVWTQKNATLIDASNSSPNSQVFIKDIPYLPGQTKFKGNGSSVLFNFSNVRYDWNLTSKWIGPIPKYYFGTNSGTLTNQIYPGQSLRYNSLTLDSLINSFGYIKK